MVPIGINLVGTTLGLQYTCKASPCQFDNFHEFYVCLLFTCKRTLALTHTELKACTIENYNNNNNTFKVLISIEPKLIII